MEDQREITYTSKTMILRSGRISYKPDWEQEVFIAGNTGLGYWINADQQYCPTHIKSGQGLLPSFRTELQVKTYIEKMSQELDWNQDVGTLEKLEVWSNIQEIAGKAAYWARRDTV